jgi:glycosyltransferase involved in cell wall biosynthesis
MKILIIQEKGRNQGNLEFREALNLSRALTRIGIENVVWGLNYENFKIPFDEISKDCDVVILLENYEVNGWIPNLGNFKGLKLFWSIDSHCNLQQHISTCDKHKIDLVLNAVYGHEKLFKQNCNYFPNAYPEDLIKPIDDIEKINDVGFCGNFLNRKQWIDFIESNGILVKKDIFVIGNEMVKSINSYKIHFNRNLSVDINFRTFETLGCKTLLLTNYTPGLENLFEINKNIVIYEDQKDLINKIKYFLENKEHREHLTQKGYEHVVKYHTYDTRATELVDIIKNI